jgi:hypothetical protein
MNRLTQLKHSLITLSFSKGFFFFFFLANISVILYEVIVAALALLTDSENVA